MKQSHQHPLTNYLKNKRHPVVRMRLVKKNTQARRVGICCMERKHLAGQKELFDRAFGKPLQTNEIKGEDVEPIQHSIITIRIPEKANNH